MYNRSWLWAAHDREYRIIVSDAESHVMYQVGNARVRPFPYPHVFIKDVFPADYFANLQRHLPPDGEYQPIAEGGRVARADGSTEALYPERFIINFQSEHFQEMNSESLAVWSELGEWLLSADLRLFILSKFENLLHQRFGDSLETITFHSSAQLFRDFTNYSLGPHADHPSKVIVLLFYLPAAPDTEHLGTAIYLPHKPGTHADTGEHFSRDDFSLLATMPYRPNCATGFFKTPNAFHGVERVAGPAERRDLLQFNITYRDPAA